MGPGGESREGGFFIMPGPAPKPAALKIIEGNRGRRPINMHEPKPLEERPACPKYLTGEARKAFKLICQQLEGMTLLRKADTHVIIALATACGQLAEARKHYLAQGSKMVVVSGRMGTEIMNPLIAIINRSMAMISKLSAQLALDPTARARIVMPAVAKKTLKEQLAEMGNRV